jgi:hypothetical protein
MGLLMARFTPTEILAAYSSVGPLNAMFEDIATLFELAVFRDGSATNTMLANLNLNNFKIQNLGDGVDTSDAVNLGQVTTLIDTTLASYNAPEITIGTVTTLAVGESATASLTGTYPDLVLNLGLPRGATGSGTTAAFADITGAVSTNANLQAALDLKANLASPAFTGNPTAPTATLGDNDTSIATTAFVTAAIAAHDASPTLTGTPVAPTAAFGTATTQIATTAFVDRLRDIPLARNAAAPTLALTDRGQLVEATSGPITIPANASIAFPVGSTVILYNDSASGVSVQITTDTLRWAGSASTGARTLAQRGYAFLRKRATTEWVISGDLT